MTIKTEVKQLKDNKIELNVEVPVDKFKESITKTYRDVSKKAKIPGFRVGKVPAKVVDSYFGKGYVVQQALENNLPEYYSQAVRDSGIRPIDTPNIEIISVDEGKALKFKAQVEVEPEVKLPSYKELKVDYEKPKVKQEDVDQQLELIRNRFAELNPAPAKIADKGDHLLLNFDGTIDNKPFEGGSAQNYLLELGSNAFLPEFENQLIGSKAGDIKNITVQIPPTVPSKDIAGKTAVFKVLVKETKVKKLPELTDKFVKDNLGLESVDALKKEITKDIQKALDKQADTQYRIALIKQLAEKAKVDIPSKMIEDTANEMVAEFEQSLKSQGTNLDNYLKSTKTTEADLRKNLQKSAEERTRQQLAMTALIEQEKLTVTDDEVNKAIEEFSDNKEKPLTRKELEEKSLMGYLKSNILYKKALDFIAKKIEVKKEGEKQ